MTAGFLRAVASQRIIPLPNGYELIVHESNEVGVWGGNVHFRSLANWIEAEGSTPDKPWITCTRAFPADLVALIRGVLMGGLAAPLIDWLIENGPENLSDELRRANG